MKLLDFTDCSVANCIPLLIQQNVGGWSVFFNRSWEEYKVGFNDSQGNYWLGNELLSQLTVSGRYKLKFDLQSRENTSNWYSAEYSTFRVLNETYDYMLEVAGYRGNSGYDAFGENNGIMFSTYDRDNDLHSGNCAILKGGGFWYTRCALCSVNGYQERYESHFYWYGLAQGTWHLETSRMWLQCKK